jgi:hypothetical protein
VIRVRVGPFAVVAALAVFLVIPSTASAGWAGSPYERSDCTLSVGHDGRPSLACGKFFVVTEQVTTDLQVADASCPSGFRTIRRVETVETTVHIIDFYDGPVPLAKFNTGGNTSGVPQVVSTVDTDLGCT